MKKTCEERIDQKLRTRINQFKQALESYEKHGKVIIGKDEVYEDLIDWLNHIALAFDEDPHYRAKRLELSYGGPQDYFLFFEDGTIEYHFLDWFDGASRELTGEDYEIMEQVFDYINIK